MVTALQARTRRVTTFTYRVPSAYTWNQYKRELQSAAHFFRAPKVPKSQSRLMRAEPGYLNEFLNASRMRHVCE